jgi:osmotically-inducible protein OsmY
VIFLLLGLILLSPCASTTGRRVGELGDDSTIANTIRAKIREDGQPSIIKINTDTFNGNVTLLGRGARPGS